MEKFQKLYLEYQKLYLEGLWEILGKVHEKMEKLSKNNRVRGRFIGVIPKQILKICFLNRKNSIHKRSSTRFIETISERERIFFRNA